ncbi:gamma-glutamyl hydrolase-like protein [Trifolium pratense]|uniref:Gamma-glutamyl hydrolase-like protein n=1 Tax=Trifolium pratense TaxID=57577 RepID=A0A2K3L9A2_TRIPR|nr:gamma-glutamyl hydrolase-like protein [Trifolium pratense]
MRKDDNILEEFKAKNQASTLQFVESAHIEGTVFQRFPPDLLKKLSTDCLVMQNHAYGISPAKFLSNQKLSNFFEILTTCNDEEDKVLNNMFSCLCFHDTFTKISGDRLPMASRAYLTLFYFHRSGSSEARKSATRPVAQELFDNLIYNYSPTFYAKAGKAYDEVYIFV